MRKIFNLTMVLSLMLWSAAVVFAAEHGGASVEKKEHGGTATQKEHGGTSAPSADAIRAAMKDYVMDKSKATGTFDVTDPETGKTRKLELIRVHERVGKTGDYFYSCADFKDTETGQMLDLDLDVQDKGGKLSVVDVRVHKVEGKERYTYDENDNRIPLNAEGSHVEGSNTEEHEHDGKEHGGKTQKEHGGN
ncbi:MAG TPA: hypothetical protein DD723_03070 [Candidatus Omnitrophica bacterium]|nr:MAG: hypothetical protein A2Z81_01205 [Omnitrophica WOR_2 bacterium GWA2_45_18]HBR14510.1 hypothetical protein [Candidatus Omnitrophota bacterium]